MVGVYLRVATKEQCDVLPDIKTVSDKILNDIKSNRYLLSPKYRLLLKKQQKK